MRPRKIFSLVTTAVLVFLSGVFIASPAEAHPIYRRAFVNVYTSKCIWANPTWEGPPNYTQSCAKTPNTAAKWKLHVVDDSYGTTGHEVWVLESIAYPGSCLNTNFGLTDRKYCDWAYRTYPNRFEAFYSSVDGNGRYQLKDLHAWEKYRQHECLSVNEINDIVTSVPCDTMGQREYWVVSAAA